MSSINGGVVIILALAVFVIIYLIVEQVADEAASREADAGWCHRCQREHLRPEPCPLRGEW